MRALLGLVIGMGVLIVAGTATIAVTILHRMVAGAPHAGPSAILAEPAGTRIVGITSYGNRLAVALQGGGPDRVVIVDPASGQNFGRLTLTHP
jgi:hypothetical protein